MHFIQDDNAGNDRMLCINRRRQNKMRDIDGDLAEIREQRQRRVPRSIDMMDIKDFGRLDTTKDAEILVLKQLMARIQMSL